jgi:DNA modification methylase
MKIESVAIELIAFDPANARKHSQKNLDSIKGSLAKFGQQKPIVVGKNNVVIAGNGTVEAARSLGWDKIQVVRTELVGTDATAFALADNRTSELAEWDAGILSETLKSLKALDFDLSAVGFDAADLEKMTAKEIAPGLTDDDALPENVNTRCKPGDLWHLGAHKLLCGDSTNVQHVERLMGGEKAQTFFIDPPYGDNVGGLSPKTAAEKIPGKSVIKRDVFLANDQAIDWLEDVFNIVPGFLEEISTKMIFFKWDKHQEILKMAACFGRPSALCVWDRVRRANNFFRFQPQHELVFHWGSQEDKKEPLSLSNVWHEPKEDDSKEMHPTVKPIAIMEPAIRVTTSTNKIVLDLFLGSGSTLIACEKTARRCFGMEIDAHYCDVVLKRWEDFTGKTATLLSPKDTP